MSVDGYGGWLCCCQEGCTIWCDDWVNYPCTGDVVCRDKLSYHWRIV